MNKCISIIDTNKIQNIYKLICVFVYFLFLEILLNII